MGYKQFLRSVEAAQRRQEREALRRHRELVKHIASQNKEAEKQRAADEVAMFENYLEVLVSVHKDCGDTWDWQSLSTAPPPIAPSRTTAREDAARDKLSFYQPGFFEKLFGKAKKRQAELEATVEQATAQDRRQNEHALAQHQHANALWQIRREIGAGVLRNDPAAYKKALKHLDPFSELVAFKTRIEVEAIDGDVVSLSCFLEDEELVPKEELKLTAGGKMSTKQMAAGKYWALHQDFVCSCALRAARETFATLPISRVIVNVRATRLDTSTGHHRATTLLAVHFARPDLARLDMDAIDPSDSMKNFPHRMKFKKSTGFEPVEDITVDEQWVTT